jgi:two-component system sensor histidine kinase EvgS
MDRCLAKPLTVNQLQSLLPCGEDCVADLPALDMTELERLSAGNPLVLGELVQVLIETTEGDLRSLRQCALGRDLPGLHLLAHRIKGGVRMVNAQELVAACQAMEDQCLAPQPAISALADDLRRLGLEVLRLLLGLRRYKASRLRSGPAATGSAIPPAPRR